MYSKKVVSVQNSIYIHLFQKLEKDSIKQDEKHKVGSSPKLKVGQPAARAPKMHFDSWLRKFSGVLLNNVLICMTRHSDRNS